MFSHLDLNNNFSPKPDASDFSSNNSFNTLDHLKLKQCINNLFDYEIDELDLKFMRDLYAEITRSSKMWLQIGNDYELKELFYRDFTDALKNKTSSEYERVSLLRQEIDEKILLAKQMCNELQFQYEDIESFQILNDLNLNDQLDLVNREIELMNEKKREKIEEFNQLVSIKNNLCTKLNIPKFNIHFNRAPTQIEYESLELEISELAELYRKRKNEISKTKREILSMLNELDLSESCLGQFSSDLVRMPVEELRLGDMELNLAHESRTQLRNKYLVFCDNVKTLFLNVQKFFVKFEPKIEDYDKFLYSIIFEKYETVAKLYPKHSLPKQLEIIRENLISDQLKSNYIKKLHEELGAYFKKMYLSEKEVESYEHLFSKNDLSEFYIGLIEECLELIKFEYLESESLYHKVGEWLELWNKWKQFEEKTKDPHRFKLKGYNFLEEAKIRKSFETQLPKIEEELADLTCEYKLLTKKEFTIYQLSHKEFLCMTKNNKIFI